MNGKAVAKAKNQAQIHICSKSDANQRAAPQLPALRLAPRPRRRQ